MKLLPSAMFLLAALTLSACNGDFDQRIEVARTIPPGGQSTGTTTNPSGGAFIRGTVSIAGAVRNALVTLRPVLDDGSIDLDDSHALGVTVTFTNGIYQAIVRDTTYRGPIVVEVRGQNSGGVQSDGANPATAVTDQFHDMLSGHVLYGLVPMYEGPSVGSVDVTPLTTCAVTRAQFLGGISAGMYGVCQRNLGEFFAIGGIRLVVPFDFANGGSFGNSDSYGYILCALGQVARNVGVTNVFDFYSGMARDTLDDGILNGSIGFIPNTGIAMPDLGAANLLSDALNDDYLAPGNVDRVRGPSNTALTPDLVTLLGDLAPARDINSPTYVYSLILRAPGNLDIARGAEYHTRIFASEYIGGTFVEVYGDSGGPSLVDYAFVSSSPANVSVSPFGRIVVPMGAAVGTYTLALTISPAPAQTLVTGPVLVFTITINVR